MSIVGVRDEVRLGECSGIDLAVWCARNGVRAAFQHAQLTERHATRRIDVGINGHQILDAGGRPRQQSAAPPLNFVGHTLFRDREGGQERGGIIAVVRIFDRDRHLYGLAAGGCDLRSACDRPFRIDKHSSFSSRDDVGVGNFISLNGFHIGTTGDDSTLDAYYIGVLPGIDDRLEEAIVQFRGLGLHGRLRLGIGLALQAIRLVLGG